MPTHHIQEDHMLQSVQTDFAFDGASPFVMGTVPANAMLLQTLVVVSTLFNDVGAVAEAGTEAVTNELFSTADVDITSPGNTVINHYTVITTPKTYQLTLEPVGATQGAGRIITTYIIAPAG